MWCQNAASRGREGGTKNKKGRTAQIIGAIFD